MHHAGTGCAGALGDGGAVEDDRGNLAGRHRVEFRFGWHADRKILDAIVEGQIERVFAQARVQALNDHLVDHLPVGSGHSRPTPLPVLVAGIEVESARPDRRHVRSVQPLLVQGVVDPDHGGIGLEPHHHPGAVPTEIPDFLGHLSVGHGRESVKPALAFKVGPGTTLDAPAGDIAPVQYGLLRGRRSDRRDRFSRVCGRFPAAGGTDQGGHRKQCEKTDDGFVFHRIHHGASPFTRKVLFPMPLTDGLIQELIRIPDFVDSLSLPNDGHFVALVRGNKR